ncbi:anti-sigma factor [Burkholderia gladioli]|uniref:anti-sigma factor n=1 Tax=Burkholderia gladioli TaxID=28095 RepID=UPI00163F0906|nr:anti-sigma factor [Burkholderia gladioli]
MTTPPELDPDLRCAEYVLGVLDADERRALEASVERDPRLRDTLLRWERRLAPLAEAVPAVAPPARIWQRIQRDLGWLDAPSAPRAAPARVGWWNNLVLWRWVGIGASVAVVALLAVDLGTLEKPATPVALAPSYLVATIAREDGTAHWTATVDLQRAQMIVTPAVKPSIAADRSTELWLIAPGAKPVALGVFPSDAPATMSLPPQIVAQLKTQAVLAVSVEPTGGSPTGQPTGPVIATGQVHTA